MTANYVLAIIFSIFLLYIINLVRHKRLLLKYSLLWMTLSFLMIFCSIFPEPIFEISRILGLQVASNFIFLIAIICLLAICLSLSIIASKQTAYSKTLLQEIALIRKRIDRNGD